MEQLSDTDLALLLQSDDEEEAEDSAATEADQHLLTVDEIILNQSSPSPPSSPRDDVYFPTGGKNHNIGPHVVLIIRGLVLLAIPTEPSTWVGFCHICLVVGWGNLIQNLELLWRLPQLPLATPHAVAIKSMRATTGAMRSVVSDTSAIAAVCDELLPSQSSVASGGTQNWFDSGTDLEGLGFSESLDAEEVGWEELQSAKLDSISEKADAVEGHSSGRGVNEAEVLTNFKTSAEVGDDEVPRIANWGGGGGECATLNFETFTPVENEKESVLDEVSEVTAEGFPSDITREDDVTAQHLSVVVAMNMPYGDEHKTRGEE